jgi:hypothetical protein
MRLKVLYCMLKLSVRRIQASAISGVHPVDCERFDGREGALIRILSCNVCLAQTILNSASRLTLAGEVLPIV